MKIITVINGTERMILQPENKLEEELIEKMNGASCTVIKSGSMAVLENNINGGLLIQKEKNAINQPVEKTIHINDQV